jgi:Carboxypeptidase regulatory-like domain
VSDPFGCCICRIGHLPKFPRNRGTHLAIDGENLSRDQRRPRTMPLLSRCLIPFILLLTSGIAAQTAAPKPEGAAPGTTVTGIVQGGVTGKDGEVYEGVRVALALVGAEPVRVQVTNGEGEFTFLNVPAGPFTLTVSSDGFATQTVSGVLQPGTAFDVPNIELVMSSATTEVRVSAAQQEEIAQQQLQIEEKQLVLGVVPNFYVSYDPHPVPLTARQKYSLAWKSNINPFTWLITGAFAGFEQANNTFAGYGQGMQGYGKRFGANYADTFISTEIGGAILPALLRQDPRYFYKGKGTIWERARYAIAATVICKGDNMHWQFNYSSILGGLAAGGISNLYYPASDRSGAGVTFENAGIGLAGSAAQNLFQEFVVKKLTPSARKAASP